MKNSSKLKKRKPEVPLPGFEAVLDTLPVLIVVLDKKLNALLANRAFCQSRGLKEEELAGKSIYELLSPKRVEQRRLDKLVLKVINGGKPIELKEIQGLIPKASEKILNIRIVGMRGKDAILLMDDVTEKVYLGEQLRQTAKMSAIGQFTAGIIHEVNNPISIISGHAQYMLNRLRHIRFDKLNPQDYKECLNTLKTIEKVSRRIGGITSRLLHFSRKGQVKMVPTDINETIEDTLHLLEHQLAISDVKVIRDMDPNLPPVRANPDQLQQVFINLTINAFKAMPRGGKLIIKTLPGKKRFAQVMFTNTGKRIPPQDMGRIFEPFFTTKQGALGTGLGLSVVYSIISAHKGIIEVDSSPRKGTTFTILLPFSKEKK